jgi:hypothetical protein
MMDGYLRILFQLLGLFNSDSSDGYIMERMTGAAEKYKAVQILH